jgi:hypothetical protein
MRYVSLKVLSWLAMSDIPDPAVVRARLLLLVPVEDKLTELKADWRRLELVMEKEAVGLMPSLRIEDDHVGIWESGG